MNFDPLSFVIGKHGDSGPVRDVVSYLIGRAVGTTGEVWQTLTDVAVATFTAVSTSLRELVIDVTPVQAGSGDPSPENVRPISGWTGANVTRTGKNLIGGIEAANRIAAGAVTYTIDTTSKTITFKTVAGSGASLLLSVNRNSSAYFPFKSNTAYTIIGRMNKSGGTGAFGLGFSYSDGTSKQFKVSDTDAQEYLVMTSDPTKTLVSVYVGYTAANNQVVYYDTLGIYEGTLTKADAEAFVGTTYPVSWQSEAGAVYGGTLDVTTGMLTITHIAMTLGDIEALTDSATGTGKFARYDFPSVFIPQTTIPVMVQGEVFKGVLYENRGAAWTGNANFYNNFLMVFVPSDATVSVVNTALSGTRTVMELVTPQIVQLTPTEVNALIGANNIFADCGNINTITFRTH